MRLRILLAGLTVLLTAATLPAQIAGDVMGVHNLGPGSTSPITGARPDSCAYCHAPHSGLNTGLWNQKLTTQTYTTYTSSTEKNIGTQPLLGSDSNKCLSCHDGTVAVGNTVAYGQVTMRGDMDARDKLSYPDGNMQRSHPFSLALPFKDNTHLVSTLAANGQTADATHTVKLIKGNVECTTCHNPHVQVKDLVSRNFLVKDSSSGQLCLACHDPSRQVGGQVNPLADWSTSAHAMATNAQISPQALLGSYTTVAADACISCHTPHNSAGPTQVLRGQNEQDCIACHNGANVSPMPQYANVFSEYAKPKVGHPIPDSLNPHDGLEDTPEPGGKILLQNNRHATCVDCHNAHGSEPVTVFPPPPLIRISQKDVAGISASDGTTKLTPAINQYENCLRCHGSSAGGATTQSLAPYGYEPARTVAGGEPRNEIPQFGATAISSHPVMHPINTTTNLPQPSLRSNMMNLDGVTLGRAMGQQIFCTDCHNSDDNRESGGSGANGPHGSIYPHILERAYKLSQSLPGQAISNLSPSPDLSVSGPYALCAKCHDLGNIMSNASWSQHNRHITLGFSCSVCHTAHGTGSSSANVSGERLVNFDLQVVAPNGGTLSYNRSTNTCALQCHLYAHNPDGSVTPAVRRGPLVKK